MAIYLQMCLLQLDDLALVLQDSSEGVFWAGF